MPIFITQGRFTQDALKGMMAKPEDRAEIVSRFVAKLGGKLLAYYLTFGEFDFLVITEGLNNETAAVGAIVSGATGGVTHVKTTLAMTSAEMKDAFAKAGQVAASFRAAGR